MRQGSASDELVTGDPKKGGVLLILILIVAAAIRIGWAIRQPVDAKAIDALPDQREYLELGRSVLSARSGSTLRFFDPRFEQFSYAYRAPGYPIFVALCGGDVRIVRLVQALIDAATVLAAYFLARQWISCKGALWAAAAVAFNPFLIYFSGLVLTETLFTAVLAWGFVLLGGRRFSWARLLAGGIMLAIGVVIKPSAIALPALACAGAAWAGLRSESGSSSGESAKTYAHRTSYGSYSPPTPIMEAGKIAAAAIAGALLTVLVLLPWAWRNDRVLGQWIWTTTNAGITEYDGFHPAATGASNQSFIGDEAALPDLRQPSWNEVDRDRYFARLARQWAVDHPAAVLKLAIVKIARTWTPIPLSAEYGRPVYEIIAACYAVPFDVLLVMGLIWRWRRGAVGKMLMLLPACYLTILCALSVGSLRYRVPAEPLLAVCVGAALASIGKAAAKKPTQQLA